MSETEQALDQDDFELSSFFEVGGDNEPVQQDKEGAVKKAEPVKEDQEKNESRSEENIEDTPPKKEADEKGIDYKAELEKAQKAIRDTQRSFHEDRKKLAAYKKAVEKLAEEGSLTEEESTILLDHTKHEEAPEDVPLLTKYCNIWDKEIESMREVYEKGYIPKPPEFEQNILAFQHFIQTASSKDRQDALDDLSMFEDNPIQLTKKMMEMGRQYNDDIYSDIQEAGGIKNLKSMYSKKEQKLKNRIDKLEEENNILKESISKGYDKEHPNYGAVYGGGGNVNIDENAPFDIKSFLGR